MRETKRTVGPTDRRAGKLASLASTLRQVWGMPDYERYVEHLALRHPGEPPLTRAAYFAQYLERRYGTGHGGCPTRCC